MTRRPDPNAADVIGDPIDQTAGLGLFAQREASPEVGRPVATARMRGGRETALERLAPHLTGLRGRVYAGITAHGPITRERLAETLAMKENTVNGRCAELVKAGFVRVTGYDLTTGRGLLAIVAPEGAADA